ncbi:hypothetical protein [Corynebacterium renale]|uniref:hypothetical protein n=1 Tax=Corynebacterium renale TaxID=1724 RepID=UPI000DFED1C0|nr:hypothetical protein [Corynebacterium renale]STC97473.1 Uncharacterised protein [Corynebacterium renale]STD70249.1 Uncharacterised protein [Corynebacterium renale]
MSEKTPITLETPLETLTTAELEAHQRACWDRSTEIDAERQRRQALPYVWASETKMVETLRQVMGNAPKPGAAWKQPANITAAYIAGDTVTHDGKNWQATGDGAIMHAPGTTHPIMGDRWHQTPTNH